MKLNELHPPKGSVKPKKRVGRGSGSGHGKTSTRGTKGLLSRSGGRIRPGFEGGQMPIIRRIPKRGFTNKFRIEYQRVNVKDLNRFDVNQRVDQNLLYETGLIKHKDRPVKILGDGQLDKALIVEVDKFSNSAVKKIKEAGGSIQIKAYMD